MLPIAELEKQDLLLIPAKGKTNCYRRSSSAVADEVSILDRGAQISLRQGIVKETDTQPWDDRLLVRILDER